jgi:hypothetical protein
LKNSLLLVAVLCLSLFVSCGKNKSQNFPNEMSEMANAMREMVTQLEQARSDLKAGKTAQLNFKSFHNYELTDESFNKPGLESMSQFLLTQSKTFDKNPTAESYKNVIISCQSCHIYLCPGPLELINTLNY